MPVHPTPPVEQRTYQCPSCGGSENAGRRTRYGTYTEAHRRCLDCGMYYEVCNYGGHGEVTAQTIRGHEICTRCLYLNYYRGCNRCQRYTNDRETVITPGGRTENFCYECREGFPECDVCFRRLHETNGVRDIDNRLYCSSCRDDQLVQCEGCNAYRRLHRSARCSCGSSEPACRCYDCRAMRRQEERRSDVSFVNEWNYRPNPVFHGKGPLFLGMELEMETGDDAYDECREIVKKHTTRDLCYLKADGSISCGFELVTHPMDFDWAIENFPWEMLVDLRRAGADTHQRVGLHVHLSRAGFDSPTHIFKWMKFIYRNSDQVTTLAGRESYDWAAFNPDDRENIKHACKGDKQGGRYRAINTLNDATFEMRVFRSTLNPHKAKAFLGLADASVRYTRELSTSDILQGGWNWSSFYTWLSDKPKYKDLKERMEELNITGTEQ